MVVKSFVFKIPGRKKFQLLGTRTQNVRDYRNSPHYKGDLNQVLEHFAETLGKSDDYIVRLTEIAGRSAACIFITTVCDHKAVEECLRSLQQHQFPRLSPKDLAQYLTEKVLPSSNSIYVTNLHALRESITSGDLVLLVDGVVPAIVLGAKFVEHRTPEQPYIESSVRGPQISFVENLDINIGLLRQILNTDTLRIKKLNVGYRTRTDVAVVFLEDVANPTLINTVLERINAVHVDTINQGAELEHLIIDHKSSIFPLTRTAQRTDSVAHEVNQGKVVIFVDGDPTVLMVPATIRDFFQTSEDFSHTFHEATLVRWLRFVSFMFGLYLPALYISFTDYNPELLPKVLGLQIAKSREGVPFPAFIEVLIMQLIIEILREATLRMPKQMGQTIGIVGGLVVGEASVQAGIVSNILIIVVALAAVSIFVSPSYEFAIVIRVGTWVMDVAAAFFGLYGVVLVTIAGIYEVCFLKSFGVSYADPFSGEYFRDLVTDGIIRAPYNLFRQRPRHLRVQDQTAESRYRNPAKHAPLSTSSPPSKKGNWRRPLK
nr:spore germination protein [Alicyclobacillus ferrooxydans]